MSNDNHSPIHLRSSDRVADGGHGKDAWEGRIVLGVDPHTGRRRRKLVRGRTRAEVQAKLDRLAATVDRQVR